MNLRKLKVKNFLGLSAAELEFAAPVTMVLGANAAGKSSLRDALEFAVTGLCRGMTKKKDAPCLARAGARDARVELEAEGFSFSRTPSSLSTTEQDLQRRFGPPERFAALCNAWRFLDLSPAQRRELVAALSADPGKIEALAFEEFRKAGLPESEARDLARSAAEDVDRAENEAVTHRRELKRRIAELPETTPPQKATIGGKEYDLEAGKLAETEAYLAKLRKAHQDALRAAGEASLLDSPEVIRQKIAELGQKLKKIGPVDPQVRLTLCNKQTEASRELAEAREALARAEGAESVAAERYRAAERLAATCPACGQDVPAAYRQRMIDEAIAAGEKSAEALEKARARVADAEAALKQAGARFDAEKKRTDEVADLALEESALKANLEESAGHEEAERKAAELEAKVATVEQIITAKREYDAAKTAAAQRDRLNAELLLWDYAAQVLGKDGPVRKLAASGFNLDEVQAGSDALLGGRAVEVDGDWNVRLGGVPAELLSRSERFRLGASFAAALSLAAGLELLVIDEADVLGKANRAQFLGWLGSLAEDFGTILVLATTDEEIKPSPVPWLQVVSLNGKLERITT